VEDRAKARELGGEGKVKGEARAGRGTERLKWPKPRIAYASGMPGRTMLGVEVGRRKRATKSEEGEIKKPLRRGLAG